MTRRALTDKERVLRRFPHALLIRPGEFANDRNNPLYYVSANEIAGLDGARGGCLIGQGETARQAWANAARNLPAQRGRKK